MVNIMVPDYPLASDAYYDGQISDAYTVKAAKLKGKLVHISTVSLTVDLWTSRANDAYLGIMLYYILADGLLCARLLDCVELPADQRAAKNIANTMKARFEYWGIVDKVIVVISDNGQNMVNALEYHLKIKYVIGCFAHSTTLASTRLSR